MRCDERRWQQREREREESEWELNFSGVVKLTLTHSSVRTYVRPAALLSMQHAG